MCSIRSTNISSARSQQAMEPPGTPVARPAEVGAQYSVAAALSDWRGGLVRAEAVATQTALPVTDAVAMAYVEVEEVEEVEGAEAPGRGPPIEPFRSWDFDPSPDATPPRYGGGSHVLTPSSIHVAPPARSGVSTPLSAHVARPAGRRIPPMAPIPTGMQEALSMPSVAQGLRYLDPITDCLTRVVQDNDLHCFYQPAQLRGVASRVAQRVDFAALARGWALNPEIVLALASLALYDVVVYVDDSGSMAQGGRWHDLRAILDRVTETASLFNDTGIAVHFMNSSKIGHEIRNQVDVQHLLAGIAPSGLTPTAQQLEAKVLRNILSLAQAHMLRKPVLVICITDGVPSPESQGDTARLLAATKHRLNLLSLPARTVAYQFVQVGDDGDASDFLESLDRDPQVGSFLDTTGHYAEEQSQFLTRGIELTPDMYMVKLMVGAIDNDDSWPPRFLTSRQ